MNKKTKKIASVVLGWTIVGAVIGGCSSSHKGSHSDMGKAKSDHSGHSSCGSANCGATDKK